MKKIFLALFFIVLFGFSYKTVEAQCVPSTGENCFRCQWQGISCEAVVESYVPGGSAGCASGFDQDDSVCQAITDAGVCNATVNQNCVLVTPNVEGFRCDSTTFGCFPCTTGDTSPGCNPIEYSISAYGSVAAAAQACNAACTGATGTRFACVNFQCVESGSGSFDNIGDCAAACNRGNTKCRAPGDPANVDEWTGIDTAIGCVPASNSQNFSRFILGWALGIGGGIAFLLIVYAGFLITSSAGNPQRLAAGKELLVAALSGLLLLIFSAFLLRIIGANILGLFN